MSIGIGISTTPGRNVLTLDNWDRYMPPGTYAIAVTDDKHEGVAKTKNKLLRELDRHEHIFLFDDDTWTISDWWWQPYISSPEKHLMYQFDLPGRKKMGLLHADGEITAWSHTRGAMIYLHRSVLDIVGGFDEHYKFGYEHADLTNRIHNAGLTTYRAMDVVGSNKLLYCLDQDGKVESSVPEKLRRREMAKNRALYQKSKTSTEFKEYK